MRVRFINPYISLVKNTTKHISTVMYEISANEAAVQRIISTMSFIAYANDRNLDLLKVRYAAIKLVATYMVLGIMFAVPNSLSIK